MKISGFTFTRNAVEFYFPVKESILSILPVCDEFIVVVGNGWDNTLEVVKSIKSGKIKIIKTIWDESLFDKGKIHAQQSNIALDNCAGDWCFYLQSDEVVHEDDLPIIQEKLKRYKDVLEVEGLLFDYLHFYGDYDHYQWSHRWYKHEIRVVRNGIGARSYSDAQGFRKDNGKKLKVVRAEAKIFHYGWVRPPDTMKKKMKNFQMHYLGREKVKGKFKDESHFDLMDIERLPVYKETHPKVMEERIKSKDWQTPKPSDRKKFREDKLRNRILTFLENRVFHRPLFTSHNYLLLKERKL